mgnify:CR=1 FL=1
MVVFLVFFLLLAGDTFKRKLVKLTGPSLSRKKVTVHILDDINTSIQNYMFMLLVTNILLALLTWVALRAIGLDSDLGTAGQAEQNLADDDFGFFAARIVAGENQLIGMA